MERAEQRPNHGPMQLLADEGQIDQVVERGLQLRADRLALMRLVEGWQMVGESD